METPVLQYLKNNGIDCLYHFTSRKNWPSIRNKGICSLCFLEQNELIPSEYGSDYLDRERRQKSGLDDYISLSFSPHPKFLDYAQKAGILIDYISIKVSLDVLFAPEVRFYDKYPLDEDAKYGTDLSFIENILLAPRLIGEFEQDDSAPQKRCRWSEVSVKRFIPANYILNREELDANGLTIQQANQELFVFILDQTETMAPPIRFQGAQYSSCANLAMRMLNKGITCIVNSVDLNQGVKDNEIAIIGYGNTCSLSWQEGITETATKTVHELLSFKETHFWADDDSIAWVVEKSNAESATSFDDAIFNAKTLIEKWLFSHPGCKVFVYHISNGRSIRRISQKVERASTELLTLPEITFNNLQLTEHSDLSILFSNTGLIDELDPYGSCLYRISSPITKSKQAFSINVNLEDILKEYLKQSV